MEEEKPQETVGNRYWTYIKSNKYNLYFIGAIALLLFAIIFLITFMTHSSDRNIVTEPTTIPNQSQTISQVPSTVPVSAAPSQATETVITPDPTQAENIKDQTQQQISQSVAVPYTISNITLYGNNWSLITITNDSVGGGGVIAKKENGQWVVVLGPGTFFPKQQLESIGAPQSLIDNFYPTTSPSPAP